MERGILTRTAVVIVVLLTAATFLAAIPSLISGKSVGLEAAALNETYGKPLYDGVIEHIIAAVSVAFILFNFHAVLAFVRRTLTRTDELIIGNWYVYRYTKTQGVVKLLADVWSIRRNLARKYIVSIKPEKRKGMIDTGELIYNERDRFNILLQGFDHKEQSLICFSPRISVFGDTRVLGLGVGDDADYTLSTRIYLASRTPLQVEYVKSILDDASVSIRNSSKEQLIQLPHNMISDIFSQHPLPD